MNPKLLEIWQSTRYEYKPSDYFVVMGFGLASMFSNSLFFTYTFGAVFLMQIVKLFAITLTDGRIIEDLNIKTAKRIFNKLKKENDGDN